jgi:hypothetical protein
MSRGDRTDVVLMDALRADFGASVIAGDATSVV